MHFNAAFLEMEKQNAVKPWNDNIKMVKLD